MSARLAPSSRPLPLLFVAFLSFFVLPWPSPLRVINVIIIPTEDKLFTSSLSLSLDCANEDAHAFNCQALTATQWRIAPKPSTTMDSEGGTSTKQADFEPFDDATNYGEQDCADAFDDEGLSAWYFDQA